MYQCFKLKILISVTVFSAIPKGNEAAAHTLEVVPDQNCLKGKTEIYFSIYFKFKKKKSLLKEYSNMLIRISSNQLSVSLQSELRP